MTLKRWKIAQWFELRWWKNYLNGKDKEEYLQWKKDYWQNILNKISDEVKIDAGKSVGDFGCGPSGIFIAITESKITAVDPLIDEYEKQTPFFSKGDYPNVTFVKSTIEEFETQKKFDIVFCMNAINHVHSIEKGFEQLKNYCSQNGIVVVSIDAHNLSFFKYLFRLLPGDILHPHQYNLEEYQKLLQNQGMRITRTELLKTEFFFNHYLITTR